MTAQMKTNDFFKQNKNIIVLIYAFKTKLLERKEVVGSNPGKHDSKKKIPGESGAEVQ